MLSDPAKQLDEKEERSVEAKVAGAGPYLILRLLAGDYSEWTESKLRNKLPGRRPDGSILR